MLTLLEHWLLALSCKAHPPRQWATCSTSGAWPVIIVRPLPNHLLTDVPKVHLSHRRHRKNLLKIAAFIGIAVLAYSPMGGHGIHVPAAPTTRESWAAANYTADAWATDNWDWGGEQQQQRQF